MAESPQSGILSQSLGLEVFPRPAKHESDAVQLVPFLTPPAGRPPVSNEDAAREVRRRLSTPQSLGALQKIDGRTPFYKRVLDVIGSSIIMMILAPMLLFVGLLIKCTDAGPVLFWQRRVGLRGRLFWCPKFRSMVPNANRLVRLLVSRNGHSQTQRDKKTKTDVTFKMRDDPRITWIGKIIRKLSIDEMPQLWCVFKGEMSLVGPRPALPSEVARYSPGDRRRLEVTPGLTCIWQVSGRGDLPFPVQVEMDVEYISKQSLWFDLTLLVKTVPAVLRGRGAY